MNPQTGEVVHNPTREEIRKNNLIPIPDADAKFLESIEDPAERLMEARLISWRLTSKKDFQGAMDKARRSNAFRDGWMDCYQMFAEKAESLGISLCQT